MQVLFLIMLFVLGACFGSFLCCQARRLRLKDSHRKSLGSRSVCLSCKTKLKWYDNIPIFSWLMLRGKCRTCGKSIGATEILSEVVMGLALVLLGTTIDVSAAGLQDWLVFCTAALLTLMLGFLAIYDGAYGELPTPILYASIAVAMILLCLKEWSWLQISSFRPEFIIDPILSVLFLGGLYLVLFLASKGKWVGDGDWLLGVSIGLALANPWLSLVTLFLANLLACVVMLPFMKSDKTRRIHLGPFLVIAFVITFSLSDYILSLIVL